MNPILAEITALAHQGVSIRDGAPGPGSGRYPLGSGENAYQRPRDFIGRVEKMRKEGFTYTDKNGKSYKGDTAIAKAFGMSSTEFRARCGIARYEARSAEVARAKELRDQGYSLERIAKEMGYKNDSSIRSLLNSDSERRMSQAMNTANFLKKMVDERGMLDVGVGTELALGVSKEKLNEALVIMKDQGYPVYGNRVPQVTNAGKLTTLRVLCPPGSEAKDIYDYGNIHYINDYVSHDGGETFDPKFVYPKSMDSKRLSIRYAEDGGINKDGVIELRRNVEDLSLGQSTYAQVRILVDDKYYMKGMAVYSDKMPDGVDVVFNTNKSKGTPMPKVLKPISEDPNNPFKSLIKDGIVDPSDPSKTEGGQSYYYDKNGQKQLSLINKRAEEGDWGEWSKNLPSQFLAKQPQKLIDRQLGLASADKQAEFDEICSLTNPTVKKVLLQSFADDCDSAAEHLKAAALPRQRYQVILPLETIKDNEVYAPNYRNGEEVALVRYPHGGTFEIPILKVNNKQKEGQAVLGKNPIDAIGINKKVADRLSGADFDGDTVMVIPTGNNVKIVSTHPLKGLEGFDPKVQYGGKPEGTFKLMRNTQNEMGKVSNLIMDMTLKGATEDELARAVRHSMVVIDAEKHKLDYRQSEKDNGIRELKRKYQGRVENGKYTESASTLITRAKAETTVTKRQGSPRIDPETGEQYWKTVDDPYYTVTKTRKKTGETVTVVKERTQKSTQMRETRDARTLSSGEPAEEAYAAYANKMKSLANEARKLMLRTGKIEYSSAAKQTYKDEEVSLMAKLQVALKNAPLERQAQTIANSVIAAKEADNPDMTKAERKKLAQRELTQARTAVGAQRRPVVIEDREWEAIQAGAISESKLLQILRNTNIDDVKQRAMPREMANLSSAKISLIQTMSASGNYSNEEIAQRLGVSSSTVTKYLK